MKYIVPSIYPYRKAFTLIELLIVVTIIAILAAIAVPNFLEAQTRAKVATVRSDMRTIATALEAYAVDHNRYPPVTSTFTDIADRLVPLTTPVAFLTALPSDPFVRNAGTFIGLNSTEDPTGSIYLYNTANNTFGSGNTSSGALTRWGWALTSGGPDLEINFPYYPFGRSFIAANTYANFIYDPTNGTVSAGDIFKRGGQTAQHIPAIDSQF